MNHSQQSRIYRLRSGGRADVYAERRVGVHGPAAALSRAELVACGHGGLGTLRQNELCGCVVSDNRILSLAG
jgi:hypothetical protein